MEKFTGLQKAIRRVGSVARFANVLGVTQATVMAWLKDDKTEAPPETLPEESGVRKAVEKAGSQAGMARELGVSAQVVGVWLRNGHVPPQRAMEIENIWGVPRAELVSAKMRNAMGLGGEL
jgi:DNA-binding transcriptional regulator YdaS (Cro superfamily)